MNAKRHFKENAKRKSLFNYAAFSKTLFQISVFWQPANAKWEILHAELLCTEHKLLPQYARLTLLHTRTHAPAALSHTSTQVTYGLDKAQVDSLL